MQRFAHLLLLFPSVVADIAGVTGEAEIDESEADYDESIGADSTDPVYARFMARVRRGGQDQVLRYVQPTASHSALSGGAPRPLALSSEGNVDPETVPHCQYCGAHRQFEFQVGSMCSLELLSTELNRF